MVRPAREDFKTFGGFYDRFTMRNIFELESKGFYDQETLSPIKVGKEAHVFSGEGKDGKVVLKIYRLEACDFTRMYTYMAPDPRFVGLQKQRRKVIFAWCQREFRNLMTAREAGVAAPLPIAFKDNILIMSYIGGEKPAPQLKDVPPENLDNFFGEIIENMRRFYTAGFVHGDLSKFNILNLNDKPILIDFSQGTTLRNPNAMQFLERDVHNVSEYFRKLGVDIDENKELKKIREQSVH